MGTEILAELITQVIQIVIQPYTAAAGTFCSKQIH